MEAMLIGKFVENYKIIGVLGKGGMSTVFKAIDQTLDREVALKIMESQLSRRKDFVKRFRTEGRSQACLKHPNIVNIYAMREAADGLFIVMEYVAGGTLKKRIARDGPFAPLEALNILKQLLLAIKHAHSRGIIHRDIKPANILLDNSDVVKVTDFGLAKMQRDFGVTSTDIAVGTLGYSPPEQLKSLKNTDQRSDLYSIGMTFYEIIAGKLPFNDNDSNLSVQLAILEGKLPSPDLLNPEIPAEFVNLIRKATRKDPADRYQSAAEMLQDVLALEQRYIQAMRKRDQRGAFRRLPAGAGPSSGSTRPGGALPEERPAPAAPPQRRLSDRAAQPLRRVFRSLQKRYEVNLRAMGILTLVIVSLLVVGSGGSIYTHGQRPDGAAGLASPVIPLSIFSRPEGASVYLNGFQIGTTPLKDYLVRTGEAALKIVKDNYLAIDTSMVFFPGDTAAFSLRLSSGGSELLALTGSGRHSRRADTLNVPQYGRIKVISSPPGAAITLNGTPVTAAQTPHIFEKMPPGRYRLELAKKGYHPAITHFEVVAQESRPLRVSLTPQVGNLYITSNPPGADVWLNGKRLAGVRTPAELPEIPVGLQRITLQKPGFEKYTARVEVAPRKTRQVRGNLRPVQARLSVVVLPYGSTFVDGELKKHNTNIPYNDVLSAGRYVIQTVHPKLGTWEKELVVDRSLQHQYIVDFNRQFRLPVTIQDDRGNRLSGARIYVDQREVALHADGTLELRTGQHLLEVRREGYVLREGPMKLNLDEHSVRTLNFVMEPAR